MESVPSQCAWCHPIPFCLLNGVVSFLWIWELMPLGSWEPRRQMFPYRCNRAKNDTPPGLPKLSLSLFLSIWILSPQELLYPIPTKLLEYRKLILPVGDHWVSTNVTQPLSDLLTVNSNFLISSCTKTQLRDIRD